VLALYRKHDPDVFFFVVADEKTPSEAYEFCTALENCKIYSPNQQDRMDFRCSDLLGWNTITRRNIALLRALAWGAEVIYTIDDDNIPLSSGYFVFPQQFNGVMVEGDWFDVGQMLDPPVPHRGFPRQVLDQSWRAVPAVDKKVGVAAGICLGDPDIDAVERMVNHPTVHRVSQLLESGIIVSPNTKTVANTQNTSFLRELAPCFLMVPQLGRHDDILASLVAQRVMHERDLYMHFGRPFVWQQRNQHDLLKDLDAEIWGMKYILLFADVLDAVKLSGVSVIEDCRIIWSALTSTTWMPGGVRELTEAWLTDCEKVL